MEIEKFTIEGSEFTASNIINLNFSSLTQLLSILVKKCNSLEEKVNSLNADLNEKENRLSKVETSLNINNEESNYITISPRRNKKDSTDKKDFNINNSFELIDNSPEKENDDENFKNKEKIELNYTMFSELYKKVRDHGKFIKNIINTLNLNKTNELENKQEIKDKFDLLNLTLENEIRKTSSFIERVNEKIINYDEDIDSLKDKLKDFNLYDIFKYQNLSPEIDADFIKQILTNLESKMNKKFILYDEKIKLINSEIFKLQEEEKNNSVIISGYNMSTEKMRKLREELDIKYNDLSKKEKEDIKDINTKFAFFDNKLKLIEISNFNNEKSKDLKDKENQINELIYRNLNNNKYDAINLNNADIEKNDTIKKIKENINELDKFCKNIFNEIKIKEINDRILSLEKNSKNYLLYEDELNNINDRIKSLDFKIKEHINKGESIFPELEKIKEELSHHTKKLENLNFDLMRIKQGETTIISESKSNIIDTNKFVSSSNFNENKKENLTKFEKISKKLEEIEFNIDTMVNKFSHIPRDTDFEQFKELIKNMIENIVIKNKKQFANKLETVKSYKLLETKLNTINDSYNKKINGAENWLLAKKPLNSYQCASCESIIKGELDPKSEYVAWNKYPFREENKSYRMGHGFSHMLHMISEGLMKDTGEIMKEEEIKEKKLFIDKNKKSNLDDLSLEILPKLKKKNNIHDLSEGFDSPIQKSRELKQINKTIDNQDNTPQILKILKKNRSSIFKTAGNNNQTERPKNIKYINFNFNNQKEE